MTRIPAGKTQVLAVVLIATLSTSLLFTLPAALPASAASGYFWWVGAKSTDISALPNVGARSVIEVVSQADTNTNRVCPWVSDNLSNNVWIQIGYCTGGVYGSPGGFYQIWDLNTNTILRSAGFAVSTGPHTFAIYLKSGTTWAASYDSKEVMTYNAGSSISSSTYPVYSLVEMYNTVQVTAPINSVSFPVAMQVIKSAGQGWTDVQKASSYGTAFGVNGALQDASLYDNEIMVSSNIASIPGGTSLWDSTAQLPGTSDILSPIISVPANQILEAQSAQGAIATFSVSASDNVGVTSGPTCTPASGSMFPIGTTTVYCTAKDDAGNSGSGSFDVTVQDTAAPTTAIVSPANLAVIANSTIDVSATALDSVSLAKVQLYVDDSLAAEDSIGPFDFLLDSAKVGNGIHMLHTVAVDKSGNKGFSQSVSVEVSTPTPAKLEDTESPIITITSPVDNSVVSSTITVRMSATDNVAVSKVELYINNALKTTISPISTDFGLSVKLPRGGSIYTITAVAYDAAGNSSSDLVQVKIQTGKTR